ncbi:sugar ABC transporter ATP-binding protein [Chryseolinea sp. T2]|uniref:sugar ABC transporter ATP-binding protein n=1 Tax=Chryseolinea sp. T2 TaxID=3129255 RepID=UPI003078214C
MIIPRIDIADISKSFPGVKALKHVSLSVAAGEVHALCGENGAGKSTLMNILSGNLQPDEGQIFLNGNAFVSNGPRDALRAGIAVVFQHLSLAEEVSVAENIFVNQQPVNRFGLIDHALLNKNSRILLEELNIELDPSSIVGSLSPAQRQMVEIAKALAKDPQVLILDEPTASLTDESIRVLFEIIVRLKKRGTSVIYISHRLAEIFEIADRVSVLKDGEFKGTFPRKGLSREELIQRMVGREIKTVPRTRDESGEVILDVAGLSSHKFSNISFSLRSGEIVGMAGLIGAGRTEIARAIFGIDNYNEGEVRLRGKAIKLSHPIDAIRHGIGYVTEDRKKLGLFQEMTVTDNIAVSKAESTTESNFVDKYAALRLASDYRTRLSIATSSLDQLTVSLSGGNQQKVLLAKWLATSPEVLIIDEPTHGVDVGAKQEIYNILTDLARNGLALIVISSELPELLSLCDRILVVRRGEISGVLSAGEATEEMILSLAM